MPLREFLRGGYQTITEVTVVTSRGYPSFTVFPGNQTGRTNNRAETPRPVEDPPAKRA